MQLASLAHECWGAFRPQVFTRCQQLGAYRGSRRPPPSRSIPEPRRGGGRRPPRPPSSRRPGPGAIPVTPERGCVSRRLRPFQIANLRSAPAPPAAAPGRARNRFIYQGSVSLLNICSTHFAHRARGHTQRRITDPPQRALRTRALPLSHVSKLTTRRNSGSAAASS